MNDPSAIRETWGISEFEVCSSERLDRLPLAAEDRALLCEVGLPTGPAAALKLNLRFENVDILHTPAEIGLFAEQNDVERGPHYPGTGEPELDAWARLDAFLVLGKVPNDFAPPSPLHLNRYICVDGRSRQVVWAYPKLSQGRTCCDVLNTGLAAYLGSLLAYKQFRDQWPALTERFEDIPSDDPTYQSEAKRMHDEFLVRLAAADPCGFKGGFWESHAWNEAILLELA
jgi:hypothetical protein